MKTIFPALILALCIATPSFAKSKNYKSSVQRRIAEEAQMDEEQEEAPEEETEEAPPRQVEVSKPRKRKEKYGSVLLGFAKSTADTSDVAFAFGARIGFDLYGDSNGSIGLGLAASSASDTDRATSGGVSEELSTRVTFIAPELLARHVFGTGLYFGGRVGIGIMNLSYSKYTNSSTSAEYSGAAVTFASSSVIGYEVPFSRNVRGNLDLSYITFSKSKIHAGAITVTTANLSAFQLLAGAQFNWY